MRFQFSLATLLVCMTVLAVVSAISAKMPVWLSVHRVTYENGLNTTYADMVLVPKSPKLNDILWRSAFFGMPAIVASLGVLWTIRRLKFRRSTERPAWATDMKIAGGILIGLAVLMVPEFILSFVNHASGQMDVAEYDRGVVCVVAFFAVGIVFWWYKPRNRIY